MGRTKGLLKIKGILIYGSWGMGNVTSFADSLNIMKTICLLGILFVAGIVNGGELRVSSKEPVVVVAPDSWKATLDTQPGPSFPFETYRVEPVTNRNVVCLISIYDKDKPQFADAAFLKTLVRADSRPYVNSPDELSKIEVKELKMEGGLGFYANFVDPDLAGKPVVRGSYKTATPIIVSLSSKYLMKISLLCDEIDGADYREAISVIKSLKIKKTESKAL